MAALGPIRSTAIDGLSEKPQFDQIHGQFFLALLPVQQLLPVAQPPMLCVGHAAIGNSFDSFNINIEEILDQDGYCCRANRNFYFIHVPVPIINHIITIRTTATILTRLPGLPGMVMGHDHTLTVKYTAITIHQESLISSCLTLQHLAEAQVLHKGHLWQV